MNLHLKMLGLVRNIGNGQLILIVEKKHLFERKYHPIKESGRLKLIEKKEII